MKRITIPATIDLLNAEGITAHTIVIHKNDAPKVAICIKDINARPILYEDMLYEMMDEATESSDLVKLLRGYFSTQSGFDHKKIVQKEAILSNIIPVLYGGDYALYLYKNENALMRKFAGTVATFFRVEIDNSHFFIVSKAILKTAGIKEEDAVEAAFRNLKPRVRTLSAALADLSGRPEEFFDAGELQPYVIDTHNILFGAAAIASEHVRQSLHKSIGDYYILPSSVHEVIVLPASKKNNEAVNLVQMVKEINVTEVAPEEKLSDEVYFFDGRYLKAVNNMEM